MNEYAGPDPQPFVMASEANAGVLEAVIDLDTNRSAECHNELLAGIGMTASNAVR